MSTAEYFIYLKFQSQGKTLRSHFINKSVFIMGRAQTAEIPILSPSVSREHLKVELNEKQIFITDLGSGNGSFLDGKKIKPNTKIQVNTKNKIKLAESQEEFTLELIRKPVEYSDPESNREKLQHYYSEILKQFEKNARDQIEEFVRSEKEKVNQEIEVTKRNAQEAISKNIEESKTEQDKIKQELDTKNKNADGIIFQHIESAKQEKEKAIQEAELLKKSVHEEVSEFRKKAHEEVESLKESAKKEMDLLRKNTQDEISQRINESKEEQRRMIEESKTKAQDEYKSIIAELEERVEKMRNEILQAEQNSQTQIQQSKIKAQKDIDELIQNNKLISDKIISDAKDRANKIEADAQAKSMQIIKDAQLQSDKIMSDSNQIYQDKLEKAQELIDAEIEVYKKGLIDKAEIEKMKIINEAKERAYEEQKKINAELSSSITEKKKELEILTKKLKESTSELNSVSALSQQNKETVNTLVEEKGKLEFRIEELNAQIKNSEEVLGKVQHAQSLVNEAEQKIKDLEAEYKNKMVELENILHAKEAELQNELGELKIKKVEEIKHLEEDFNAKKIKQLDQLNENIQEEDRILRSKLKNQISEIVQSIKLKVVDETMRNKPESHEWETNIHQAISEIINDKKNSEHLVTTDVVEKKVELAEKRNKKYIKYIQILATIILIIGVYFKDEIYEKIKSINKNNYTSQVIEERKLKSLYKPEQDLNLRDNYTDNVIFVKNYVDLKVGSETLQKWTAILTDISWFDETKVPEEVMIEVVSIEVNMVRRLKDLRENIDAQYLEFGVNKMRESESEDLQRIRTLLRTDENYKKFRNKEKVFMEELLPK